MITAYVNMWKNFFNFSGKSNRPDFWWPVVVNIIINIALTIVTAIIPPLVFVSYIYSLAILIPSISITVRRLRDAGFHWAWILLCLTGIGGIVVLIMCALKSK